MLYSNDRIMTTHAGALPRPPDLGDLVLAKADGAPYDPAALAARLKSAVAEFVRQQAEYGLDCVNDGELSKTNFTDYVRWRIAGYVARPSAGPRRLSITARDEAKFPGYFAANPRARPLGPPTMPVCVEKLRYVGQADVAADLANFKAALATVSVAEGFMPANTPGTIEHWMANEYYKATKNSFLPSLKSCARSTGRSSTLGFLLQIDDPDLPDGWNCLPDITPPEYRKYAALRVEALNHALAGIPKDKVRLHVCWGSHHGPHHDDIPLLDIIDLIFRVNAGSFSIEASNPRHEHEWRVFETVRLPEGATLVPGVVGHCTDFIEHPDLVAERLVRYARLVGRENVLAGTDCGLGPRVGHPSICWAKFASLVEGARRATRTLWGRA